MKSTEIIQLQNYLRRTFNNLGIRVKEPAKETAPVEVMMGDEFIGTLHRDDDEGEVCYHFQMTILDIDLEGS
ncbi:MAG: DUF3126 family protein [Rhodobacterales bacterium]|nr:DUF3126 family protein [Rhodobacterales bacterium]